MKPYLLTSVNNNLGATAHAHLCPLDEVLPAGPGRRHTLADAPAVPGPRGRTAGDPGRGQPARATPRSTATTTVTTTASSANSAASRASNRSTPTPCRRRRASATSRSTPRSSEGQFELPPVLTRTWFHTGAFFGLRRHRRASRSSSTGPATRKRRSSRPRSCRPKRRARNCARRAARCAGASCAKRSMRSTAQRWPQIHT